MRIHLDQGENQNIIRHYGPGSVTVRETVLQRSLIVLPDRLISDWPPQTLSELTSDHLAILTTLDREVVILGTGQKLIFPSARVLALLYQAGIGVEVMDTGAACRTYNILMGEGRRVAAALMMIEG